MNVKQLIGLAAIILGGMTSCSNILEEDGVSNVITKGETGTLQINLVADGSLNVTTKSEVDLTTDYSLFLDDFTVTLTNTNNTEHKDWRAKVRLSDGSIVNLSAGGCD